MHYTSIDHKNIGGFVMLGYSNLVLPVAGAMQKSNVE